MLFGEIAELLLFAKPMTSGISSSKTLMGTLDRWNSSRKEVGTRNRANNSDLMGLDTIYHAIEYSLVSPASFFPAIPSITDLQEKKPRTQQERSRPRQARPMLQLLSLRP
jgi:hypothetical protein